MHAYASQVSTHPTNLPQLFHDLQQVLTQPYLDNTNSIASWNQSIGELALNGVLAPTIVYRAMLGGQVELMYHRTAEGEEEVWHYYRLVPLGDDCWMLVVNLDTEYRDLAEKLQQAKGRGLVASHPIFMACLANSLVRHASLPFVVQAPLSNTESAWLLLMPFRIPESRHYRSPQLRVFQVKQLLANLLHHSDMYAAFQRFDRVAWAIYRQALQPYDDEGFAAADHVPLANLVEALHDFVDGRTHDIAPRPSNEPARHANFVTHWQLVLSSAVQLAERYAYDGSKGYAFGPSNEYGYYDPRDAPPGFS